MHLMRSPLLVNILAVLLLLLFLTLVSADENGGEDFFSVEEDAIVDTSRWIDPNDPTRNDRSESRKAIKGHGEKEKVCASRESAVHSDKSMRLLLRQLFESMKVDTNQRVGFSRLARLHLSAEQVEVLDLFLEGSTERVATWEEHERVREAVKGLVEVLPETVEEGTTMMETLTALLLPYLQMLNLLVLFPSAVLLLSYMIRTRSLILVVFLTIFAFSMFTTYDRKYKENVAARLEASARHSDACRPPTLIENSLQFFSGFLFIQRKSECRKFIEAQTISVVSEIPLTEVLTEVLFDGLLSWLSSLGRHTNRFFINLYADLPIPLALVVSLLVFLFSLIFLIFAFGYRIRVPFLIALEPHGPAPLAAMAGAVAHAVSGSQAAGTQSLGVPPQPQFLPGPPQTQSLPAPNQTQFLPGPSGQTQFLPGPCQDQFLPGPSQTQFLAPPPPQQSHSLPVYIGAEEQAAPESPPSPRRQATPTRQHFSPSSFVTPRSQERTARMKAREEEGKENLKRSQSAPKREERRESIVF